jgi:LysR family transcriptional regulator, hydrogen peroxide-inducible genes activator
MNLQELSYFVAVAEHRHFGRAAQACHVSQPTLSGQLLKLEQQLGVTLFERNNRSVSITPVGEKILEHARRALEEAGLVESVAKTSRDQLVGPLKLGVIPTLAPYLIPLILGPLREAYPRLTIELWEDVTVSLLERLRSQRLDAALLATEIPESDLTTVVLFDEPFLAALPSSHRLASRKRIDQADLADDLLVLADGHCLAGQAREACGRTRRIGDALPQRALQAASLETLANLVAAGYGTTLAPQLAASSMERRGVVLRPLLGKASRTIRLASRPTFPRPKALQALVRVIAMQRLTMPNQSGSVRRVFMDKRACRVTTLERG